MMDAQLKETSKRAQSNSGRRPARRYRTQSARRRAQLDPNVDTDLARGQTAQENRSQGIIRATAQDIESTEQTSSEDLGRQHCRTR